MITAVFTDNSDYARATGLWQWDYGQRLRIEGLKLPTAVEIHFALTEQSGDAITRVGTTKDGVTEVVIPDSLLENQAAGATYEIYAWIYLADKTSGETIKRISMQVKRRPKPEGHDTPEDAELFRDAIEAVNASADRAETAREGAEAAQEAAEAAAGKIEGEITGAGQIAEQVKQDAEAVAKDKQAVSQMATETTQNAQKAAEAAQAAERSSTAAKEAQTGAESAEAGAEAAMEEVERDRVEVSETHKAVEQLREAVDTDRQAVAADRQAVENTATQFEQTAQSAINAVGQAQEAAVGAVSAEGQRQTTAVQRAGTQAVSDVGTAKTEAIQAVTTEGDTQTKRVQDAATGIVADREQIAANKQAIEGKVDKQQGADNAGKALVVGKDGTVELGDAQTKTDPTLTESGQAADAQVTGQEIATLQQNKADAIVDTAQGDTMTLTDSSDKLFRGLRVFGKSTQDGTPSVENPVPIVSAGESGSITVTVNGAEPQSLTLATPNGLPGVPVSKDGNYTDENGQQYICDEVDLGRGKYVQRIKDFIITQDTQISTAMGAYGAPEKDTILARYLDRAIKKNGAILCRELIHIPNWNVDSESVHTTETSIDFRLLRKRLGLETETTTDENKTAVLKFLETTPLHCLVELNTPIERDLTPEELAACEALHTNYPTTVITNDAGAHMEASYVADTGTYIRNMEERLNAKLVNIQSALISQKISGEGIKITDSSRVPVVRFAMWGKTEQRKTTGKNLINIPEIKAETGNIEVICNITRNAVFSCRKEGVVITKSIWRVQFKYENGDSAYLTDDNISSGVVKVTEDNPIVSIIYRGMYIKSGRYTDIQLEYGSSATAYEPYTGGKPSPSPDYSQPIEITDQPVTVTIKGGTEQQSITLIPPKPMTKWDKLEKVDGVWCWVYQHKVLSGAEIKENCKGIHSSGAVMISISTLGAADGQNDAVSDKFIYSTRSVATLKNGEFRIVYGNAYLKIDGVATAEEGRQWLESNDITIIAQASTPESIPLSPSEQAQLNAITMYAGTTEVTNTGGCNMELTYTVDTKSYVDSKIAAISAAVLEV